MKYTFGDAVLHLQQPGVCQLEDVRPGTYNVLMQLRIVITGVIYQQAFAKRLNRYQWAALVLISLGCMVKESAKLTSGEGLRANQAAWLLLLCQMLASVFAGVYNEVLLKGDGAVAPPGGGGVTTNLQNAICTSSRSRGMASSCCRAGWVRPSRRTIWRRSSRRPCLRSSASCLAWGRDRLSSSISTPC